MSPAPDPPDLSTEQLRAVLDGVVDALIVTDGTGEVLYRNAAAASLVDPEALPQRYGGEATVRPLPDARADGGPPLSLVTIRDAAEPLGSRDRYRVAFEAQAAPTLIAALDDGIVLDANDGLPALLGSTKARTIGRSLVDLGLLPEHVWPGEAIADLTAGCVVDLVLVDPATSEGDPATPAGDAATPVEDAATPEGDGDPGERGRRSLLVSARPVDVDGRRCGVFAFVDVTAEREAQAALRALTRFGAGLETVQSFDDLVRRGLRDLITQLGLDFGTCQQITPDGTRFHSLEGDAPPSLAARLRQVLPPGLGTIGHVTRTGVPQLVPDHREFEFAVPAALAEGVVTTLSLPVKVDGDTAFVLTVGSLHRRVEVRADATETAMAYVRRLEHALERVAHLREIEGTREATFRALGLALEQREFEPAGHMDRVVASSQAFARELGLSDEETQALTWGAYLHDAGKIGLPDAVLLEPGRRGVPGSDLEDRHPLSGIALLRDVPFLPVGTRQVVRSHHERWDGTGYPDGLAGAEIPLLARVFALVDTFDALTSPRSHRAAWSDEEAVREVGLGAGSQFDPGLVPPFLRSVGAPRAGP